MCVYIYSGPSLMSCHYLYCFMAAAGMEDTAKRRKLLPPALPLTP